MPRRRLSHSLRNGGHMFAGDSSADEATAVASIAPPNYSSIGTVDRSSVFDENTKSNVPVKKGFFDQLRAIELENTGSTARDHLALERTFLAWLRTSLAFVAIGVGISQLFRLNTTIKTTNPPPGYVALRHMGKPLGITFLATAIIILLIGVNRYFETQGWLMRGKFPASRGSIFILTAVVASLIITTLVVVLVVESVDVTHDRAR